MYTFVVTAQAWYVFENEGLGARCKYVLNRLLVQLAAWVCESWSQSGTREGLARWSCAVDVDISGGEWALLEVCVVGGRGVVVVNVLPGCMVRVCGEKVLEGYAEGTYGVCNGVHSRAIGAKGDRGVVGCPLWW